MAEPTTKLTMQDLCTRVAREAGMYYNGVSGTSPALPPVDIDDLHSVKDVVNDGIEMFINDAPPSGWQWKKRIMEVPITGTRVTGTADSTSTTTLVDLTLATTYDADDDLNDWWIYILTGTGAGSFAQITDYTTLTGTCTVADWLDQYGNAGGTDPAADSTYAITTYETTAGDIGRYPLSEDFGGEVTGKITYARDATHTQRIERVSESEIRELAHAAPTTAARPYKAAIRPLEPLTGLGPKRRYELLVYPDPSGNDTLTFPYAVGFNKLGIESGVATSITAGSYLFADSARSETDDYFNGQTFTIVDGPGKGESATVSDYTASTGTFTFTAGTWFAVTPTTSSVYIVEPANNLHPAGIMFDFAIKSACFAEADINFGLNNGRSDKYHQKDLPLAHRKDARTQMHVIRDRSSRVPRQREWNPVTYTPGL